MQSERESLPQRIAALRSDLGLFRLFSQKLMTALQFVRDEPSASSFIGLTWLSEWEFAANARIFASFLNRKANTTRFNFRHHGISSTGRLSPDSAEQFPDGRNWQVHVCAHSLLEGDPKVIFPFCRKKTPPAKADFITKNSPGMTSKDSSTTEPEQSDLGGDMEGLGDDSNSWSPHDISD
jgi:hypothetical protein